jgi:hypothetical protein
MVETQINSSLKYMDWNPYLHSVNDDLNVITALIPYCYDLGKHNVKKLAIHLQALYYSREAFIRRPETLKRINEVVGQMHNPNFQKDYADLKDTAVQYEYKCIKELLDCYSDIVRAFSKHNLIPEVQFTEVEKGDPMYEGVAV